jgi:hypothetical protein
MYKRMALDPCLLETMRLSEVKVDDHFTVYIAACRLFSIARRQRLKWDRRQKSGHLGLH